MRHNCIRDLEAEIMQEVCSDVRIEPELMLLDNNLMRNGNNAENARLDVSDIGVWGPFERTFLDTRKYYTNLFSLSLNLIDFDKVEQLKCYSA